MSEDGIDAVLEQTIRSERYLLSGILEDETGGNADWCMNQGLDEEMFYDPNHQQIYGIVTAMRNDGNSLDYLEVHRRILTSKFSSDNMQRAMFEVERVQSGDKIVKLEACFKMVKDYHINRLLRKAAMGINQDIADGQKPEDIVTGVRALLDNVDKSQVESMSPSSEFIELAYDQLENPKKNPGLPTGLNGIDAVLDGMKPQQLIVLGARPGIGKTSIAVNVCNHIADIWKKPIAFFSMEMSKEELGIRMIASHAEINERRYKKGLYSGDPQALQKVEVARQALVAAPIFCDDQPNLTVSRIASRSRAIQNKHGLGCVIVDYLQLCNAEKDTGRTREERISHIAQALKNLAKSLRVPVFCLAQLNREMEKENRRPRKSDLRESGAIEQAADIILLLHQDEQMESTIGPNNGTQVEAIIAKHRNGETSKQGQIMLEFIPFWTKYKDWIVTGSQQQNMKGV